MKIHNPIVSWTLREVCYALVLSARRNSLHNFEKQIAASLGCGSVVLTNLGRSALTLGLAALDLPPGSGILVPAILCPTVVHAILRAGHRPIIVDTNEDLHISPESISPESLHGAKAILIAHLYGMAAPMPSLLNWASARGLLVIDDAAQAAGLSLDGTPLGSCGDMGILSFGPYKSIASSRGGALISRNELLIARCRAIVGPRENLSGALRRVLGCLAKQHLPAASRAIKATIVKRKGAGKGSDYVPESINPNSGGDPIAALNALECIVAQSVFSRASSIVASRASHAGHICTFLRGYAGLDLIGMPHTPFMSIPVRIKSSLTAEDALAHLRKNNIDAIRIYRPLHLYNEFAPFAIQSLPQSLKSWDKVFLLPNPVHGSIARYILQLRMGLAAMGFFNANQDAASSARIPRQN